MFCHSCGGTMMRGSLGSPNHMEGNVGDPASAPLPSASVLARKPRRPSGYARSAAASGVCRSATLPNGLLAARALHHLRPGSLAIPNKRENVPSCLHRHEKALRILLTKDVFRWEARV